MKNLFETAIKLGNFKTLVRAFREADLIDIISNDGPYTLFAPTDEAFSKLPSQKLENIFHDKEKLTEILTYHIVSNKLMSKDAIKLDYIKTVNGKEIRINSKNEVKINNLTVIKLDIECSNGVIHIIDKVLIPK